MGKTDRNFITRLDEHASDKNSAIFNHLFKCDNFKFMSSLFALPVNNHNKKTNIDTLSHLRNAVLNNTCILTMNPRFSNLCFLESLFIKSLRPELNKGIKASKELALF